MDSYWNESRWSDLIYNALKGASPHRIFIKLWLTTSIFGRVNSHGKAKKNFDQPFWSKFLGWPHNFSACIFKSRIAVNFGNAETFFENEMVKLQWTSPRPSHVSFFCFPQRAALTRCCVPTRDSRNWILQIENKLQAVHSVSFLMENCCYESVSQLTEYITKKPFSSLFHNLA